MIEGQVVSSQQFVPPVTLREGYMTHGPLDMRSVEVMCNGQAVRVPVVSLPEVIKVLETFAG